MTDAFSSHDGTQRAGDLSRSEDDALHAAALKVLQASGYPALRRLRCEVAQSVVVVHGVLPCYHLKQVAQAVILHLDGLRSVRSLIEVRRGDCLQPTAPDDNRLPSEALDDALRAAFVPGTVEKSDP